MNERQFSRGIRILDGAEVSVNQPGEVKFRARSHILIRRSHHLVWHCIERGRERAHRQYMELASNKSNKKKKAIKDPAAGPNRQPASCCIPPKIDAFLIAIRPRKITSACTMRHGFTHRRALRRFIPPGSRSRLNPSKSPLPHPRASGRNNRQRSTAVPIRPRTLRSSFSLGQRTTTQRSRSILRSASLKNGL